MDFNMQLPVWLVKELNDYSNNRSTQYIIKKILKDVVNSEEGRIILERIREGE